MKKAKLRVEYEFVVEYSTDSQLQHFKDSVLTDPSKRTTIFGTDGISECKRNEKGKIVSVTPMKS